MELFDDAAKSVHRGVSIQLQEEFERFLEEVVMGGLVDADEAEQPFEGRVAAEVSTERPGLRIFVPTSIWLADPGVGGKSKMGEVPENLSVRAASKGVNTG